MGAAEDLSRGRAKLLRGALEPGEADGLGAGRARGRVHVAQGGSEGAQGESLARHRVRRGASAADLSESAKSDCPRADTPDVRYGGEPDIGETELEVPLQAAS